MLSLRPVFILINPFNGYQLVVNVKNLVNKLYAEKNRNRAPPCHPESRGPKFGIQFDIEADNEIVLRHGLSVSISEPDCHTGVASI